MTKKIPSEYLFCECTSPACRLRFPAARLDPRANLCPRCGAATRLEDALNAGGHVSMAVARLPGPPLEALLDNIRSTFNVGAMFRTADGAGLRCLHLCGITPLPDHPRLARTALGAESALQWQGSSNSLETARQLKASGMRLWALEGGERAEPLFEAALALTDQPVVLVVGNELAGVDPALLDECERVLAIPMQGMKRSLNVAVAFGVAVYYLRGLTQRGA